MLAVGSVSISMSAHSVAVNAAFMVSVSGFVADESFARSSASLMALVWETTMVCDFLGFCFLTGLGINGLEHGTRVGDIGKRRQLTTCHKVNEISKFFVGESADSEVL